MATKKLEEATKADIVLSIILPFWGLVIGLVAFLRGEKKRGQTMMGTGLAFLVLWIALRYSL